MKALSIIAIAAGLLFGQGARAEDIQAGHLRIELDVKGGRKLPSDADQKKEYVKNWKIGCDKLGNALLAAKGPYGFGAFKTFACYRGDKLVGGEAQKTRWTLRMTDGRDEVKFVLKHRDTRGANIVVEYTMPSSEDTLAFFQDEEFVDVVAYAILDGAPMGMLVSKGSVKGDPPRFKGRYWRAGKARDFKYDVPDAPEQLVLYRLRWDDTEMQWRSETVGTAKRVKVNLPKKKRDEKSTTLVGGDVIYEATLDVAEALKEGDLWAQSAAGPGANHKEMQEELKEAQISIAAAAQSGKLGDFMLGKFDLLSSLLSSTASGYVGVRYGRQVLPSSGSLGALLNKTSTFGLLLEIRGGPAKGLRYYYDLLPKAKATVPGVDGPVDLSIQFSRHTLGYSFDFDPGFLIDRVTVDPKAGVWTFNATLPTEVDDSGQVLNTANFHLGSTLSLGLELGLEELSDWYTIRGWYGLNTGISTVKTGGKVTSNEFGLDAYFTAGPTISFFGMPLKTALMIFYYFESVTLTANKRSGELAPGQSDISGVSYTVGYAGAGLALSW